MTETKTTRCLIIGAGPAGYTAAVYAARANLKPVVIEGLQPGGQLTITTDVENWPGDVNVLGPDLMARMQAQVDQLGVERIADVITHVDFTPADGTRLAYGDSGTVYQAETVVLATGAKARWLGLESERAFMGRGVSACATCDGFFYRNRDVAVVGGGNTAVEEALYLAGIANHVYLIHRRDSLRAEKILQDRMFATPNVTVLWNREVKEMVGDEMGVTGVELAGGLAEPERVHVHGVFIAIGHAPATGFLEGQVPLYPSGYVRTEAIGKRDGQAVGVITRVPGVFAAGDVADRTYQQAVTAAAMGCMAALEAERYLAELDAAEVAAHADTAA
ncbi:thioredoxin-disulfide reductase [Rhodovibrio sodomensis]|uniref:Thioredoxin reductase n=1 Tax=Rhodovibrio sodomensis TaxID=1088 RepID=A0ABS1D8I2_9PROT|nr:thioredoxin-disulfide reductase [Rhodovibrio sodomensis]MBK1666675.1 thioredoxin-disulfide reductase [Rhodovibrio sodomensis]